MWARQRGLMFDAKKSSFATSIGPVVRWDSGLGPGFSNAARDSRYSGSPL